MKKIGLVFLFSIIFTVVSNEASATEISIFDEGNDTEWKWGGSGVIKVDSFTHGDTSLNNNEPDNISEQITLLSVSPYPVNESTDGGGTFASPVKIHTSTIPIGNSSVTVEFTVKDGKFIMFEQDDYHYYLQNWTQGRFNAAIGLITSQTGSYMLGHLTYRYASKLPFVKKIYDVNNKLIKDYAVHTGAATSMVTYSLPILGDIAYTGVPRVGTKEVIVYVSKSASGPWSHRARFVLDKDTISYNTWIVN